jgi:hypothetical protein
MRRSGESDRERTDEADYDTMWIKSYMLESYKLRIACEFLLFFLMYVLSNVCMYVY